MVSIIIPSRNERFLAKTILDVLDKATGEIEVFPVLDGYDLPKEELILDNRVKYIRLPDNGSMQKRHGVNAGATLAKGKFIMCCDAHCMFGKGFDEILTRDCDLNWIVMPRRRRLNPLSWTISDGDGQPPVDYEYWMWRAFIGKFKDHKFGELHGYKWDARTIERMNILIDDTLTIQGSCWLMHKQYFEDMGFMKIKGYTGWGQEAEELCLSAWTTGGKVMVNKRTWYAHLHKGKEFGRMYFMPRSQRDASIKFSYDFWVNKNRDKFIKAINQFMPLPNWPENWVEFLNTLWKL